MTERPRSVWDSVRPLSPTDGELNLAFIFLDVAQDPEPDYKAYADKINMIVNGLYLKGWQDSSRHIYETCLVFDAEDDDE